MKAKTTVLKAVVNDKQEIDPSKIGGEMEEGIWLIRTVILQMRADPENWAGPEPLYLAALEKAGAILDSACGALHGHPDKPECVGTFEDWADVVRDRRVQEARHE